MDVDMENTLITSKDRHARRSVVDDTLVLVQSGLAIYKPLGMIYPETSFSHII